MITEEEIKELEKIGEVKRIIVDGKEEIYIRRFCGNGPVWWQKIFEPPLTLENINKTRTYLDKLKQKWCL